MTPRDDRQPAHAYAHYSRSRRKQRNWSAQNPGNIAIRAELVDAAVALAGEKLSRARDILDVGCGSGWWLEHLVGRPEVHAKLHGLELLPERVEAARHRVPAATINPGDGRQLPYARSQLRCRVAVHSPVLAARPYRRGAGAAGCVAGPGTGWSPGLVWEPRLPNPLNQHTTLIGRDLAGDAEQPTRRSISGTTTVLPALARRLGHRTEDWYPRLARIPAIRTHRLACVHRPAGQRRSETPRREPAGPT